ncbi:MAG: tetratricopeptide repeat protein [Deferribacterales bacterium]
MSVKAQVKRQELLDAVKDLLDMNISEGCRFLSVYSDSGKGKSDLMASLKRELGGDSGEYVFLGIDASYGCGCYPEQGIVTLRNGVSGAHTGYFSLFDICTLVRSEKIHGMLADTASSYFRLMSPAVSDVMSKASHSIYFTRYMYDEVGKTLPEEWFNDTVRPYISSIYAQPNQRNWHVLLEAFAECLRGLKQGTGREPVIVADNAESFYNTTDTGECWLKYLMEKAGCGTVIYLSDNKLSMQTYGELCMEMPLEGFSREQSDSFLSQKKMEREALRELIFESTGGHPALTAYLAETCELYKKSEGSEISPDMIESDPMNIVHMHLSCLPSSDSVMAKLLSGAEYFDEPLFIAVAKEFAPSVLEIDGCFGMFTGYSFVESMTDHTYRIHPYYRKYAFSTLDSDLLENINYSLYRYHIAAAETGAPLRRPMHIKEAVRHAKSVMEIDGFVDWFSSLEKKHYDMEIFSFWLHQLETAKEHISGILGASNPEASAYIDKLAFMYLKSGRAKDAENILQERLEAIAEKSGKDSSDTVPAMNKLAGFYSSTGDFTAAQAIMKKGLDIRARLTGEKSADYADSMVKMGRLEMQSGNRLKAVECMDEAEIILDKALDINDSARIEADEVMASVYSAAGQIAKAALIYHKLTSYKNEQLGPYSKEAIKSLSDYAQIIFKNGNGKKAVKLYEDLIAKTKKIYGANSRMTAAAANDLAVVYQKIREYEKSEAMHNEAITIKTNVYGTNHPSTAASFTNFGQLKYLMGDMQNAEPYYFKALQIYETVFGDRHERTALGFNNMGFITSRMGQFERAEMYYKKALEIKREVGGERTVSAAATMNNLGELLFRLGKKAEAKDLLSRAFEIYTELLGDDHECCKVVAKNLNAVGM